MFYTAGKCKKELAGVFSERKITKEHLVFKKVADVFILHKSLITDSINISV